MKNNLLLLGHLGFAKNLFDGQTAKTRNVFELLKSKGENFNKVDYFDTQDFRRSFLAILKLTKKLINCDIIVYLPERNNLKYLFPFIYIICKIRGADILYLVVGGWLDKFLFSRYMYIAMLSRIKGIFTESSMLTNNLKNWYSFKNVLTFPNFRIHSFVPTFRQNEETFKIVFMARIFREKGVDTVFRLADYIQEKYRSNHKIIIDFYGPIKEEEEDYFKGELKKYNFVSYKCILEPDQIHSTLENYDLLILPSRYSEEGFPGTIIDAYVSGIPVITSNWRFLSESVDDKLSGYIFDLDKETDFYYYVDYLYSDRTQLQKMKHFAYEKSKQYSSEIAWQILKNYLYC